MNTHTIFVCTATFIGMASDMPARAQYDPTADLCVFETPQSHWTHNNASYVAGRLIIAWSPGNETVSKYEWYFDSYDKSASPEHHNNNLYNSLGKEASRIRQNPNYTTALTLSPVRITTTGQNLRHMVFGTLHPLGYARSPEWTYSGMLVQTGTSAITATGKISCR